MHQCRLVLLHLFVCAAAGLLTDSHEGPNGAGGRIDVRPVWIDCDLAVSEHLSGARDIDDAFALSQAMSSPRLTVVGVSTVFGNALVRTLEELCCALRAALCTLHRLEESVHATMLTRTHTPTHSTAPISSYQVPDATAATRRLLARFFPLYTSGVFPGAASPLTATPTEAGDPNEAVTAMAAVLRRYAAGSDGRVDLLALGPITNIAALIRLHPQLVDRAVGRIVFVGGRRPKQAFRIGTNITLTLADM